MDYLKIQKELLTEILKRDSRNLTYCVYDEKVLLTLDGFRLFVIPKDLCFVDLEKTKKSQSTSLPSLLKKDGYKPATLTGTQIKQKDGKTFALISNDEVDVWVDAKLLPEFGKNVWFAAKGCHSAVLVFEEGSEEPIGLVLPCRAK